MVCKSGHMASSALVTHSHADLARAQLIPTGAHSILSDLKVARHWLTPAAPRHCKECSVTCLASCQLTPALALGSPCGTMAWLHPAPSAAGQQTCTQQSPGTARQSMHNTTICQPLAARHQQVLKACADYRFAQSYPPQRTCPFEWRSSFETEFWQVHRTVVQVCGRAPADLYPCPALLPQ